MIGYFHPHPYPWVLMRGISREGEPTILETIWKSRKPTGACLRWKYLDTGHHAFTNIEGRIAHWSLTKWMYMDILWWELPTAEQVLSTPKEGL